MKYLQGSIISFVLFCIFSGCEKVEQGYNLSGGNLPTNYIVINDSSFSPSSITLVGGNSVTFLNSTSSLHEIVSDDSVTIRTGLLSPQAFYFWKRDITGTYPFHCKQHPNARGVLVLTP